MENFKFDLNITLDNIDLLILSLNATTKGNRSIEEADYRLFALY